MIYDAAPLRRSVLALLVTVAACGGRAPVEEEPQPPLTGWRVGTAEHIALWYHALALTLAPVERADSFAVPRFAPGYADSATAIKRRRGVEPTPLDERAAEFGRIFQQDGYQGLQFVPLYFQNSEALFSGIDLWSQVGGDPRRVGSAAGAQVVAFLTRLFPRAAQRRAVIEWAGLVREEQQRFYTAYWQERGAALQTVVATVQGDWDALAPALSNYLDYMRLQRGEIFLVPALGPEGRMVTRGTAAPRVAVLAPPVNRHEDAVWSFIHELLYPLVGEVIRDYVAPARLREIGEESLTSRSAVRGGAILLDRAAPERAPRYRRYFLEAAGHQVPSGASELNEAFVRAFPLPPELEQGLETAVTQALAGI